MLTFSIQMPDFHELGLDGHLEHMSGSTQGKQVLRLAVRLCVVRKLSSTWSRLNLKLLFLQIKTTL